MRLSEFKDEKGIVVAAKLMVPIGKIAQNASTLQGERNNTLQFASALLLNNPAEVKEMLAILEDKEPSEYHCTAATVFRDVIDMLSDPAFLDLFGLQRQTPTSSSSASESIEV